MRAVLSIEAIGNNFRRDLNSLQSLTNFLAPGLGDRTFGHEPPSFWLAEITGKDPKYKWQRKFLRGQWDYSKSNSKGSRGIYVHFYPEEGKIYETKYKTSWKNSVRYFFTVKDCEIVEITEKEVAECLKSESEKTSLTPQGNV